AQGAASPPGHGAVRDRTGSAGAGGLGRVAHGAVCLGRGPHALLLHDRTVVLAAALRGLPAFGGPSLAAVGARAGLPLLRRGAAADPLRQPQAAGEAPSAKPALAGAAAGLRLALRLFAPGLLALSAADQGQGRKRRGLPRARLSPGTRARAGRRWRAQWARP